MAKIHSTGYGRRMPRRKWNNVPYWRERTVGPIIPFHVGHSAAAHGTEWGKKNSAKFPKWLDNFSVVNGMVMIFL